MNRFFAPFYSDQIDRTIRTDGVYRIEFNDLLFFSIISNHEFNSCIRGHFINIEREEFRFAEEIGYYLYKGLQPLMFGKFKKMRPVSGLQIARCMIDLANNDTTGNFTIESDFIQSY